MGRESSRMTNRVKLAHRFRAFLDAERTTACYFFSIWPAYWKRFILILVAGAHAGLRVERLERARLCAGPERPGAGGRRAGPPPPASACSTGAPCSWTRAPRLLAHEPHPGGLPLPEVEFDRAFPGARAAARRAQRGSSSIAAATAARRATWWRASSGSVASRRRSSTRACLPGRTRACRSTRSRARDRPLSPTPGSSSRYGCSSAPSSSTRASTRSRTRPASPRPSTSGRWGGRWRPTWWRSRCPGSSSSPACC